MQQMKVRPGVKTTSRPVLMVILAGLAMIALAAILVAVGVLFVLAKGGKDNVTGNSVVFPEGAPVAASVKEKEADAVPKKELQKAPPPKQVEDKPDPAELERAIQQRKERDRLIALDAKRQDQYQLDREAASAKLREMTARKIVSPGAYDPQR